MNNYPEIAVRIITIKENKVLLVSNDRDGFYYFIGGKVMFGETIENCAKRELQEETGLLVNLKLNKIVYIQELIKPEKSKHKFEVFIWADIDKYLELEGLNDPAHNGTDHLTWIDLKNLPKNLFPEVIAAKLEQDYKDKFENSNLSLISAS